MTDNTDPNPAATALPPGHIALRRRRWLSAIPAAGQGAADEEFSEALARAGRPPRTRPPAVLRRSCTGDPGDAA